jgi:hypothetical protein
VAKSKQSVPSKKSTRSSKKTSHDATRRAKSAHGNGTSGETTVTLDRRETRERRKGTDRRGHDAPVALERRKLERRVKVPRRRQIDPTTCERDYSSEEIEFMNALDDYKRLSGRMFPTCSEILEVLRKLGYERLPVPAGAPVEPEGSLLIDSAAVATEVGASEPGQLCL